MISDVSPLNRTKWILKGCPRCKGDQFFDNLENDIVCIDCGFRVAVDKNKEEESNLSDNHRVTSFEFQVKPSQPNGKDSEVPADTNYKDDVIVQLAIKVDGRLLATKISDWLIAHNLPVTPKNINRVYDTMMQIFPQVPEFVKIEFQEFTNIKERKIGTTLREDSLFGSRQKAVIIDNVSKDVTSEVLVDQLKLDFRQFASCPNPYCNLMGQFNFEGSDKKLDYYCPKCEITWHWEWDKEVVRE